MKKPEVTYTAGVMNVGRTYQAIVYVNRYSTDRTQDEHGYVKVPNGLRDTKNDAFNLAIVYIDVLRAQDQSVADEVAPL